MLTIRIATPTEKLTALLLLALGLAANLLRTG